MCCPRKCVSPTSAPPDIRRQAQSMIDGEATRRHRLITRSSDRPSHPSNRQAEPYTGVTTPVRDAGKSHDILPRNVLKSVPQIELWTSTTVYGTE
jgi:hypothetical protein